MTKNQHHRNIQLVKTGSAELEDYHDSDYDRGHLCPAGDMSFSEIAMSETFYMSNMSPQIAGCNRGMWLQLEDHVRSWANAFDSLYVITGGVLTSNNGSIGINQVTVPKYYYKVILDYKQPEIKMIAFLIPNADVHGSLESYAVTVDSVEQVTGIDFFPEVPDNIEKRLESSKDIGAWTFGLFR